MRSRYWADTMNAAYVDPFASRHTDEAIEKIPMEVARKIKSIGLYVLNRVITVAMSAPDDQELVRRIGQIAQMPVSSRFRVATRNRGRDCDPVLHRAGP